MASSAFLRSLRRQTANSTISPLVSRYISGNVSPARVSPSFTQTWNSLFRPFSSYRGDLGTISSSVTDAKNCNSVSYSERVTSARSSVLPFNPLSKLLVGTHFRHSAVSNNTNVTSVPHRVMSTSANQDGSDGPSHVLRPLSPHLPVYKPQVSSTSSIFNRISGAFLAVAILGFYFLCMKMGPVCLTFGSFYQLLFYTSKLTLLTVELSALAFIYHVYHSFPHIFR